MEGHQILTGDQILMPGQGQTLSTIPEGDEDIIIDNSKDAANLFQKYKTKDDDVVTLYHQDKRVQQLFNIKALSLSTEDFPGMSQEEILNQQKEILESFNKESKEEVRYAPAVRYDDNEEIEEEVQIVHRRARVTEVTSTQVISTDANPDPDTEPDTDAYPDANPDPDIDPDTDANPDATPNPDTGDTDILDTVKVVVCTIVVDGHNRDVEEEDEREKREEEEDRVYSCRAKKCLSEQA